jgi:superfamily II DNA or RNA helicase/polyhydroxyalkanoate synthesis regulator phasin
VVVDVVDAAEGSGVAPEPGQTVLVRHKIWEAIAVASTRANGEAIHRVTLECISDDTLGRQIDVIWEREVEPVSLETISLPSLERIDSPEKLEAFLAALRWSSSSLIEGSALQAPFRSGVHIEPFQQAPLMRAQQMPRVRLLIADDVGLGKTIETGLILQDLIHSQRASTILVVCPAHLKTKWVDEMADKFGLEFRIIERETVESMRREFGPTINPWASFPRLVTSLDYLKTEHPRRLLEELAHHRLHEAPARKPWDVLVLDEAHNVAPAGRRAYVLDSDRTKLMRAIAGYFEHRIFLTATPHNGYRESFTGLLELLDHLRFSRGTELDQAQKDAVTVRRLKQQIKKPDGSPQFPVRIIKPRDEVQDPELYVDLPDNERELFDLLDRYTASRLARVSARNHSATQFALTLLKKRALSSPLAIRESIIVHAASVGVRDQLDVGESLFLKLARREEEDWSDDEEREESLDEALDAAGRILDALEPDERRWLERISRIARSYADDHGFKPDSKAKALLSWIELNLKDGVGWNNERAIIFTEYRHTQEYLARILEAAGLGDAVLQIYGGMPTEDRRRAGEIFQASPSEHSCRILLATDAASEGADFQRYCRNLIHYEIPWNPVRLEQRNGRIDRYGQRSPEVRIHHFVFRGQQDSEFLKRIVDKIEAIRADLGSVGPLIAESVRNRSLGQKVDLSHIESDARRALARKELRVTPQDSDAGERSVEASEKARQELGLTEEAEIKALRVALELEGYPSAIVFEDEKVFRLKEVPISWRECRGLAPREGLGPTLTFDRALANEDPSIEVVHLNHPLMQRVLRVFRAHMWGSSGLGGSNLARATIEVSGGVGEPVLIAWGRLLLLGPDSNRLHESLVRYACRVVDGRLDPLSASDVDMILEAPRRPLSEVTDSLCAELNSYRDQLREGLAQAGEAKGGELAAMLMARGELSANQARALCTDRMSAIRKALREWERARASDEQRLPFDEFEQKETDMITLQAQLDELKQEREREPKRLKRLYRLEHSRVYPVAYQVLLPDGLS